MRICFVLFCAFFVVGCVKISPEAEQVMLHSSTSTILDDCKRLGPVTAEASLWSVMTMQEGYLQAENNLREAAYKQYGADTVVMVNTDQFATRIVAQGVAFTCD